jgi:hypothetical protein
VTDRNVVCKTDRSRRCWQELSHRYNLVEIALRCTFSPIPAQFVNNVWIESYDPTIEDSYRKQFEVDVRFLQSVCTIGLIRTPGTPCYARDLGYSGDGAVQ